MNPDDLVMTILGTAEGKRDPYPYYHQLREQAPVHFNDAIGVWYLTRYDDCRAVLRDPAFGKSGGQGLRIVDGATNRGPRRAESMLSLNPPDHTRIRGLVSRAFTPRRVETLRPAITAMAEEALDAMADVEGPVDVIDTLAFPLPVRVIGELVGVPASDRDWFRPRTADLVATLEPLVDDETAARAQVSGEEITGYLVDLVAAKRKTPGDDLLSDLVAIEAAGDRLSNDELITNTLLMFTAGFETTTNLIGNGLLALLRNPDQMQRLRDEPGLVGSAVDEMLRFDSPVQLDARVALEPATVAGHDVEPGTGVVTLLGAANRDPAATSDPDRFDIGRTDVALMSFASGIHYCLGASLAKLEGQIVFDRLLARFDRIELAVDEPPRKAALTLRGLESLPVTVAS